MLSNLIYKELRLAAHPNLFIFTSLGALVIVPSYPYGMVFIFGCLALYITLMYGRETNDIYYTSLLPVKKRDIVKAKCVLAMLTQAAQVLISLPFAIIRPYILPDGNPAGIEANVAYYGIGLIVYALFNAVFFTEFFKTAYKAGRAFLLAIIPVTILVAAMETIVHIPGFLWIDSIAPEMLVRQLPFLFAGIIVYIAGMIMTYRIAAKRFERVDL